MVEGDREDIVRAADQDGFDGGWLIDTEDGQFHHASPWECLRLNAL